MSSTFEHCLVLREYLSIYGGVAQLGEHLPCKQGVESSNLFISTEIERFQDGLIAQLVRAHA